MPLLALWKSNPSEINQLSIEQVVGTAGDGNLKDSSDCSQELRAYLSQVTSSKLKSYVERCLSTPLNKGGLILQDLINELGRRLEYSVENGRYQGISGTAGFDGLWDSEEGHTIIVEVKTTDAYRISLNTIMGYRDKLVASGRVTGVASVLIVTGREDTGELEAQVRGSRHAWDIRLISADALMKLVQLKEEAEGTETGTKIRSLLTPMEYTRLDQLIDVMFTTTADITSAVQAELQDDDDTTGRELEERLANNEAESGWKFTPRILMQKKRDEIFAALSAREQTNLIAKSLASYWNSDHTIRAVCTISKRYSNRTHPYWYAYHPRWQQFLNEGERSFVIFGCVDKQIAYVVPAKVMHECLDSLRTTEDKYWHVDLLDSRDGHLEMFLAKTKKTLPLGPYALKLG
ncbi:hypothetical protein ABIA06_002068 [Bradyrhizobium yuanmingense]|uniref:hypothetical protein n=1 Tax=Bradyrhizobium yuanmingense TaxID=108015 RepID=UPI003511F3F2